MPDQNPENLLFYLTGYYPPPAGGYKSEAEAKMEGGALDCLGKPLRTLQDYKPGSYVSTAVDKKIIKLGTFYEIEGHPGVVFKACDVGSAIKGAHIDICVKDKKESYKVTAKGRKIKILPKPEGLK